MFQKAVELLVRSPGVTDPEYGHNAGLFQVVFAQRLLCDLLLGDRHNQAVMDRQAWYALVHQLDRCTEHCLAFDEHQVRPAEVIRAPPFEQWKLLQSLLADVLHRVTPSYSVSKRAEPARFTSGSLGKSWMK